MLAKVELIKSTIADDLRRLADDIEAGTIDPSCGVVVSADRRTGMIATTFIGEGRRYSEMMGLLAYAQAHCFQLAQEA